MHLHGKLLAATALVALALGVVACSSPKSVATPVPPTATPTPPPPTPTPVNPQAVLQRSGAVMEGLDSFQFHLSHKSGGIPLLPGLLIQEAKGRVIRPDKISVEFSGTLGGFAVKSNLIALGGDTYLTNPLTGRWESTPTGVSPLGFFNPSRGIAAMMIQFHGPSLVPSSGGTLRLSGKLPAEALAPLVGATVKDGAISVELAVDARDFYLLEAILEGRVVPGEPETTVRVITLSEFNAAFTIEPPP